MANVNLISARRAERVRLTRLSRVLLGGFIVTCLIGVACIGLMGLKILGVSVETAEVQRDLRRLQPIVDEISKAESDRNALQQKLTTLTQAQSRTQRWFGIMDGFKKAVPEETW